MGPEATSQRTSATVLVARTRARVHEAVFALLQDEGLDAVTHMRVAQSAGVGRATLYRHWPSREELILETLASAKGPPQAPTTGDLRTDLITHLSMLQDGLCQERFGSVITSLVGRADWDPVAERLLAGLCDKGTRHITALLSAAAADGRIRADLVVEEAVARLVGPIVFTRLVVRREIDEAFVVRLVDDVLGQLISR